MKKENPIYITINNRKRERTYARTTLIDSPNRYENVILDFDKRGRVIGVEILEYESITTTNRK